MTEEATVRIEGLAAGGAGVGRVDGLATFIPRTAPGDLVRVQLERRGRFARGTLVEVLEPSPDRVDPTCDHYLRDACGGCQLQHLGYGAQLAAKRDLIGQALRRIGKRVVDVEAVRPSPRTRGYRNKVILTVRGRGRGRRAGLRRHDDPDAVFDLERCELVRAPIDRAIGELRRARTWLPDGTDYRVVLREAGPDVSMIVKGGGRWDDETRFREACPSIARVRRDVAELVDEDAPSDARDAFEQVNPEMAAQLLAHVRDEVLQVAPRRVVDGYGGQGDLAATLVAQGVAVTLIERDPAATAIARTNVPAADVRTAAVEHELSRALPADVVVLNPPRVGLDVRVCEALEAAHPRPRRLLYVSCDPATLARDLSRMPSWRLDRVTPFDLFPQTFHVETVCLLSPEAAA